MEPWSLPECAMKRPSVLVSCFGIGAHTPPAQASRSNLYVWRPWKGTGCLKTRRMYSIWICGRKTLDCAYTPSGEVDGLASVRVPLQAGGPCAVEAGAGLSRSGAGITRSVATHRRRRHAPKRDGAVSRVAPNRDLRCCGLILDVSDVALAIVLRIARLHDDASGRDAKVPPAVPRPDHHRVVGACVVVGASGRGLVLVLPVEVSVGPLHAQAGSLVERK